MSTTMRGEKLADVHNTTTFREGDAPAEPTTTKGRRLPEALGYPADAELKLVFGSAGASRSLTRRVGINSHANGAIRLHSKSTLRLESRLAPARMILNRIGPRCESLMPDPEKSPSDELDQLFAAPEAAALARQNPLTAPMAIPAGDDDPSPPPLGHRPQRMNSEDFLRRLTPVVWVTPVLLLANVAWYVFMVSQGVDPLLPDIADLLKWGGNFGPLTWNGQAWRLVSCMFVHGGLLHLGVNMWALWSAGRLLERLIGNVGYLIIYVSTGIAGSLASLWWSGDVVSVGASGAIFGLLGAFVSFIWNRSDSFPVDALARLRSSLVTCIGYNLLFGAAIPGIDQAAHVGGLLAGLGLGCILSQRLDQFTRQRRVRRNLIAAAASLVVLGILIARHAPPPSDLSKELATYEEVVPASVQKFVTAAEKYDQSATLFNAKKINAKQMEVASRQMINVVEKEILPAWHQVEEQLDSLLLAATSPRRRELLHRLQTQMKVREESWKLFVEAVRENDATKFNDFKLKWKQAEQLQQQIIQPR